jgi:signal peptidase I
MAPTIEKGDLYFSSQRTDTVEKGDIVLFYRDGVLRVSRVIAGPLDRIRMDSGKVYLNDIRLTEPYITKYDTDFSFKEQSVPFKSYFVLGDNRTLATDSRILGYIQKDEIVAIVSKIYKKMS